MEPYRLKRYPTGGLRVEVPYRGSDLLSHAMYNKSTAFTLEERIAFGLEGLLPSAVSTIEQQARRIYENILHKSDPVEKYIGLAALHDRNEVLFYRVLCDHLEEFLPIVYTPTVGLACQKFSHIFRRARGLWITPDHRGRIYEVLGNAPFEDVRLIVVTDNERILGLGDQGAGGMWIPIGKLAVYTAAAGIHPTQTLPISLDVGTDNPELLEDDLYLGWRQRRLRGVQYEVVVDEFVRAVKRRFPRAFLQWEDFKKHNALSLLDRYRTALLSFNDDIQGTGATALAGIIAASKITGTPLARQRVVILGAGAAGIGIARQFREALERAGLKGEDLFRAIGLVDIAGLLIRNGQVLDEYQLPFAWPADLADACGLGQPHDLEAVIRVVKPTVLIGACGQAGAFTEAAVRAMASSVKHPVIFPLSNPTSQCEAAPSDLMAWTEGRALMATGSPFDPVTYAGRTSRIGQINNAFIFPGLGLGALVAEAREVSNGMCRAAAECLAQQVSREDLNAGSLFPPIRDLQRVATAIAVAVVREARDSGLGRPLPDDAIRDAVASARWEPHYLPLDPI
jgi:malate dehydrogenase (oxaloacetate-decarboxylating)